ncbi:MAG: tetratricopeptide repeat protein [Candidatus Pacebacteria bacterium]|nr:tetratricopeptide repeat protein [Candidatus Paceibacterota bacterium]
MSQQKSLPTRHPDFIRAVLDRSVKMISEGQLNSAEVLLETLSGESSVIEQVAFLRGVVSMGLGQRKRAQRFLKTALEVNPHNAQAHGILGDALLEDQAAQAVAAFVAALTLDPDNSDWNIGLGKALMKCGLDDLAYDNFVDARIPDAANTTPRSESDILEESGWSNLSALDRSVLCDALFAEATRHQARRQHGRAGKIFRHLLTIDASHYLALGSVAVLEHQCGNSERATQMIVQMTRRLNDGDLLPVERLRGRLSLIETCVAIGDFATARDHIAAALAEAPEEAEVPATCAIALFNMGAARESLIFFEKAIALNQLQSTNFYCTLGSALMSINEPRRAEIAFQHAAALAPELKSAHRGLLESYIAQNRFAEAETELEKSFDDPTDPAFKEFQKRLQDASATSAGS